MAVVVLALVLAGCGYGAESEESLTREAQERGGGVTGDLVVSALTAVEADAGRDVPVVQVSAALATVDVVVVAADGDDELEVYRYGTSGLLGGKGLSGPEPTPGPARAGFRPEDVTADAFDAAVGRARTRQGEGRHVATVTAVRPEGLDLVRLSVALSDGVGTTSVEEDLT